MALSANTVWEVRTAGSDNNGGGFVTGASGTDRSQQDAAQASGTNLTVDASTNTDVTPDGHTPDAADVGNIIQITTTGGGAAFTVGFYQIASIQSGKWRLDRSPAATSSAGAAWAMGGALASPGKAAGAVVAGNTIWVCGGADPENNPYTFSSSSNVSDGRLLFTADVYLRGYLTSRGDCLPGGLKPVFKAGANSMTVVTYSGVSNARMRDFVVDGDKASRTSTNGLNTNGSGFIRNVTARNCAGDGISGTASVAWSCFASANTGFGMNVGSPAYSVAASNGSYGIRSNPTSYRCLSYGNTGDGFSYVNNELSVVECTSAGNGGDGFDHSGGAGATFTNCIAYGNTGRGLNVSGGGSKTNTVNCAYGANTAGATNGTIDAAGTITLTASPFANSGSGNYSLNSTAGGGALLRGLGFGNFPNGTTVSYPDIGVAQHQEVPSGGGSPNLNGGITQ